MTELSKTRVSTEEFSRDLLQPDVLLPDQFFGRLRRGATAEQRLLMAILADAIDCFQKNCCVNDHRSRRLFREAEQWMMSEDSDPFTFEYICDVLGLNTAYLRRGLRCWQLQCQGPRCCVARLPAAANATMTAKPVD